ncbi:AP protein [Candidatus Planktophila sulfonica]|uniref:AP protein n=2 Tax=Candidatus Planktophila sulfonica TaxID=1884904 RepID=A0A249KGE1_9ACTN|nr:AP protein [Candidatus Planktophila sulfonica]
MPSIFSSLGLTTAHDSINCGESPSGRELVFLVDGLGADVLSKFAEVAPTLSRMVLHGTITTSFPSTTATSLATLTTGEMPGAHGMLGYTVQVPRSGGRVLNSLKWDERVDPVIWQPVPTLFERASAAGIATTHVAAKRYENTGFTRAVFRGAHYKGANVSADLISETVAALQKSPSFVYLYVNDVDSAGHSDGVGSEKWLAALKSVDELVQALMQKLPNGTRIWLTADHGMINVEEKIILGQDNELLTDVAVIAGEPRMRHLYLSSDSANAENEVIARWQSALGAKVTMHTRQSAITAGLFGPNVSLDASERAGDVIAIAQANVVLLDPERADKEGAMIGHHGGDSVIESSVPLLLHSVKN